MAWFPTWKCSCRVRRLYLETWLVLASVLCSAAYWDVVSILSRGSWRYSPTGPLIDGDTFLSPGQTFVRMARGPWKLGRRPGGTAWPLLWRLKLSVGLTPSSAHTCLTSDRAPTPRDLAYSCTFGWNFQPCWTLRVSRWFKTWVAPQAF